jgi:hypothetical protein
LHTIYIERITARLTQGQTRRKAGTQSLRSSGTCKGLRDSGAAGKHATRGAAVIPIPIGDSRRALASHFAALATVNTFA